MKEELLRRVEVLDKEYFGSRSLSELARAMGDQTDSMLELPTHTNMHKQAGDLLFVLASLARNNGWDLDQLLEDAVVGSEQRRIRRFYYEAHVTIEPVFEERLEQLRAVALEYGFHVGNLLLQQRPEDTPQRSKFDSFCTGRAISKSDLRARIRSLKDRLEAEGYKVWRAKIEGTICDTRHGDSWLPLNRAHLPEKELHPRAPADGALPGRYEP